MTTKKPFWIITPWFFGGKGFDISISIWNFVCQIFAAEGISPFSHLDSSPFLSLTYLSCIASCCRQTPIFWRRGLLQTHTAPTPRWTHPSHCQRAFRYHIATHIFTTLHTDINSSTFWKWLFLWDTASSLFKCPKNQSLLLFRWPNFFNHFS